MLNTGKSKALKKWCKRKKLKVITLPVKLLKWSDLAGIPIKKI